MNKISKMMLLILMSSWCTPSSAMEENAEKFNFDSGGKRKREREITSLTDEANKEISLEPEKKKFKQVLGDEQADTPPFQLPCKELLQKAEDGDKEAISSVIKTYKNILSENMGIDETSKAQARENLLLWSRESARQGHAVAQYLLGWMYAKGLGVKMDWKQAIQLFTQAADQGLAEAQYNLATLYIDPIKTAELCNKAADQGHLDAIRYLIAMHQQGRVVKKDFKKIAELYGRLAEHGVTGAYCKLGEMYEKGQGVEKNAQKAIELYTIGAEKGHAAAQFRLGRMYEQGLGVERNIDKAIELMTKVADRGSAIAQYYLGSLYQKGQLVERNIDKAVELFTKAAGQGMPHGQYTLGTMHHHAQGVEKDLKRAAQLYVQSAWGIKKISNLNQLFTFHQQTDQVYNFLHQRPFTPQINALKETLSKLHATYIYKVAFANGSNFIDTHGHNPTMQKIAERGAYLCDGLKAVLDNFNTPGLLITCLDFHQNVAGDPNLTKLRFLIDGNTYISFYDKGLELLESNQLAQNLKKEQDEIAKVTKLLEGALSEDLTKYDLDSILLGMVRSENLQQDKPSVLSAYLEEYFTLNDLESKKVYLEKLKHFLEKQQRKITSHINKADDIYSQILSLIKETTNYRNDLFVNRVWKKV